MNAFDVIVLGAGGAGLMCSAMAGQRGKRVLLLDHADRPGKKILISGGGRCNFTNKDVRPECFLSENRHFAKSALRRFTAIDFVEMVDRHQISWHEKTLGQLFCDDSARQIVRMLMDECTSEVELKLSTEISSVTHTDGLFCVNERFHAPKLVIATGGPSIPKMGATGFAYELARQFDLKVVPPRPALVPFTLGEDEILFKSLSGVAVPSIAKLGKTSFEEASLFTHKGLSGPAILQVSSYWQKGDKISLDLLPRCPNDWLVKIKEEQPRIQLNTALKSQLPARLADAIAAKFAVTHELANVSHKQLREIESKIGNWVFTPTGTEGYAKAEVTAGGVSTDELNSSTMEAKKVRGLYVIGEAVDVTGWLGGYNFQWAWSSGWAAAQAL